MDWIDLAQGGYRCKAFVKAVMNLQVSQNVQNFFSSFSIRAYPHLVS
jgi:hypothetical protein